MHQHVFETNRNLSLAMLLLFSVVVRGQVAEPKGELRLYPRATQIGTVASRTFKDDRGRAVKVIYYTGGGSLEGPYREDLLREQSIHLFSYDNHNCQIKRETYEPGMRLSRTEEVRCLDGTATPNLTTVYNARGIRQAETRHTASGSTQTVLHFDIGGNKVVAINGALPIDTDLASGWGMVFSGFACGIAANREKGRQEELEVNVSIKNISHNGIAVVMISPVLVELKDSSGRVIERKAAYRTSESNTQFDACPTYMNQAAPYVGRSQERPGYGLGEQYDRLAPGKYTLTITHCVSGVPGRLVSNTIPLEVEGRENR
jgi:hypothetical protein